MNSMDISLVVPLYNEEEVIRETHTRLRNVMNSSGFMSMTEAATAPLPLSVISAVRIPGQK